MEIRAEVVLDYPTGRWKWQAVEPEIWPEASVFMYSVVSFETEEEAQDDMNGHFRAEADITRRIVRTKEEISKLVHAAVQSCAACARSEFAPPYWHSRDDSGCNWGLNFANGEMGPECQGEMIPAIKRIRRAYNIPDEG